MSIRWLERETLDRVLAERIQKVNVVLDLSPGLQPQTFFPPRLHICCEPHPEHARILQDHFGGTSRFVILQVSALEALKVMPEESVDSVFLLNPLEHLHRDDQRLLLRQCERVARRQIVLFSPLGGGFVPQEHGLGDEDGRSLIDGHEQRARESGWTLEDFAGSWEILASRAYYTAEAKGGEPLDSPPFGAFWAIKDIERTVNLPVKLAVLAQFLPPSPSAGGVILYRMLKDLEPDDYCLLSENDYEPYSHLRSTLSRGTPNSTPRLPARYYRLPSKSNPVLSELEGEPIGAAPAAGAQGVLESSLIRSFRARLPERLKLQGARELINRWRTLRIRARRLVNEAIVCFQRARSVARIVRRERCGAILACSGDPFDLPAAYLASRLARVPFYAYIFDDYLYQWKHTVYQRFARLVEPLVLKGAAEIIVLTEFMREHYYRRHHVESTVIYPPSEAPEIEDADAPTPWPTDEGKIRIVFTGSVYRVNYGAFHNLTTAIGQLGLPEVKLHLYTPRTREELERENIRGPIVYHNPVALSDVFEVQRSADILFLPIAFDSSIPDVAKSTLPSKTVEYLASGRPILVYAPADTFVAWYFREHGCGMVVDRSDPAMLARAIRRIIEDTELRREMGERARARAETDFSLASAQTKLLKLLQSGARK
jgi:glycosyltransferase involved in cell wall biosynthesis